MDAADTQQDHERAARLLTGLPLPGLNGIALNTLPAFPALAPTAAPTGVDQLLQEYQGQVRALLHPANAEEHEYAARHAATLNELLKSALHQRPDIANFDFKAPSISYADRPMSPARASMPASFASQALSGLNLSQNPSIRANSQPARIALASTSMPSESDPLKAFVKEQLATMSSKTPLKRQQSNSAISVGSTSASTWRTDSPDALDMLASTASANSPATPTTQRTKSPRKAPPSIDFEIEVPPSPDRRNGATSPAKKRKLNRDVSVSGSEATPVSSVRNMDLDDFTPSKNRTVVVQQTEESSDLVEQVQDLLQSIFAAEDSASSQSESRAHFLPSVTFGSTQLDADTLRRLTKVLDELSKAQTSEDMIARFDASQLQRLLKLLERNIQAASDCTPIPASKFDSKTGSNPASPIKAKAKSKTRKNAKSTGAKSKARKKTKTANDDEEEEAVFSDEAATESFASSSSRGRGRKATHSSPRRSSRSRSASKSHSSHDEDEEEEERSPRKAGVGWNPDQVIALQDEMRVVQRGVLAIGCCMALWTCRKLPKKLYSEDLIALCLQTTKTHLSALVYPLAEAIGMGKGSTLADVLDNSSVHRQVEDLFQLFSSLLPRVTNLFRQEKMSESLVISAVYIAIAPFFVELDSPLVSLKTLRLHCLGLVRIVFAKHPPQRKWIVEEILTSVTQVSNIKAKTFRLHSGHSIHTVSALILHLVQSPAYGVDQTMKNKLSKIADQPDDAEGGAEESAVMRITRNEVVSASDAAFNAASMIIAFLLARSKSASKNSNGADYKAVLDCLVADVLAVYDLPEWPGAPVLATVCVQRLVATLAEAKASAENNAAKVLALEHLGAIGIVLSRRAVQVRENLLETGSKPLRSLSQCMSSPNCEIDVTRWIELQHIFLCILWRQHDADDSAVPFWATRWATEVIRCIDKISITLASDDSNLSKEQFQSIQTGLQLLSTELVQLWSQIDHGRTNFLSSRTGDDLASEIQNNMRSLSWAQGQADLFELTLQRVLQAMQGADQAAQRAKALRSLGQMIAEDADLFSRTAVRLAIEQRFRDTQSSVRDAAFDLLGEHLVLRPDLAVEYLPRISERITDTGLNVRKRVIRLLKKLYEVVPDENARTEICKKLMLRTQDEDTNIKDLAITAIEELLFGSIKGPLKTAHARRQASPSKRQDDKEQLKPQLFSEGSPSTILMNIASSIKERVPIEETLRLVIEKRLANPKAHAELMDRFKHLVEALVGNLTEHKDSLTGANRIGCTRAIETLVKADPTLLSLTSAERVLPYLLSAETEEDRLVQDHLLRTLHLCVPEFPRTNPAFSDRLEALLLDLLRKPQTNAGTLQEIIATFCLLVRHHTRHYQRLCQTFRAIDDKLLKTLEHHRSLTEKNDLNMATRSVVALTYMFSLFAQHGDFDNIRDEDAAVGDEIDDISQDSIHDYAFETLVSMHQDSKLARIQPIVLNCLGYLFQAAPVFMLRETTTEIMDNVFSQEGESGGKLRLLQLLQSFLLHQAGQVAESDREQQKALASPKKKQSPSKVLDLNQLIGNTDGFADSGVSSAVVQRYLPAILASALAYNPQMRNAALDIISCTITQGLAHPVQCLPVIVALETSSDSQVAKRALSLHATLHNKHPALVATRFLESARAAFDYRAGVTAATQVHPRGFRLDGARAVAFLTPWYNLVKDKRQGRLDFSKALLKVFSVDPTTVCTKTDVAFARYIADNLSTLEYKTQEELFIALNLLNASLASSGMQVVQLMGERLQSEQPVSQSSASGTVQACAIENVTLESLAHTSLVLTLASLLREHLKQLYKLTDTKCAKFVIGKKSAAGDKAPTQADNVSTMISYARDSYLEPGTEMTGTEDWLAQASNFEEMIVNDTSRESVELQEEEQEE